MIFFSSLLYGQENFTIKEIKECLISYDTILAIQKHTQFQSLNELKDGNDESVNAILRLADINLNLKNREFKKCDSLLQVCICDVLSGTNYYQAYCQRYYGLLYYKTKKYEEALACFLQGSDLFFYDKDTVNAIHLLKNCGSVYMKTLNYSKAEEIFNKTYHLAIKSDNMQRAKSCLLNLGAIYLHQENVEKSLANYKLVVNNYSLSKNEKALVFQNLGLTYFNIGEYTLAQTNIDSSLIYNQQLNDSLRILKAKNMLGQIAVKFGQYKKANSLFRESLDFFKGNDQWKLRMSVYYNFIDLYSNLNQKDSVLKYVRLYADCSDSLANKNNQRALLELSTKYETAQKDKEIELLNKQDELKAIKIQKQKAIIVLVTLFAVLFGGFTLIINRHRHSLAKAKKELQQKQTELNKANGDLKISSQAKDRILSVIGHDLRGPVGGLNSLIELYLEMPDLETGDVTEFLKSALESSTGTYMLLENLLTWANSQRGDITFNPHCVPVLPVVNQIIKVLDQSVNNKRIHFKTNIPPRIQGYIDIDMFKSIVRNLLGNSIKFSPDNSTITISAMENKNAIWFSIQDEGDGMENHEVETIFNKKEAYYLENVNTGKGTGLGLILCKEFVERHGGSIWVDSEKGKGACFSFVLPHQDEIMQDFKGRKN